MKVFTALLFGIFPLFAQAGDISCRGVVTNVMNYPTQCDGNYSFRNTASKGKWICVPSDKGNALVLAAYTTKAELAVYIDDKAGSLTCDTLPNYVKAKYVFL